jgi:uncharacterized protein (TIGR00369 family)
MNTTRPHNIPVDQWIDCAPFERLLKMEIVDAADGRAMLRMPFVSEFAQDAGMMHGGALVSLADTAVVIAAKSLLAPGTHFDITEIQSKFISTVREGTVTAKAKILRPTGPILYGSATVFDSREHPVLDLTSVFRIAGNKSQGMK